MPAVAIVALVHAAHAAGACTEAYEHAQERRADHDLLHAREQLLLCSKPECTDFMRQDCGQWLSEVETALPSVTVAAADEKGRALTQVKVWVDGALVLTELTGLSLPLNPGMRHFKFEAPGLITLERVRVLLYKREEVFHFN